MPAIAALTIADGQATPVNHTFSVNTTDGAKATWTDRVSGIPTGYTRFDYEVREAKQASGAHSVIISLLMPTLADIDGVMTRVRVSSASLRLNFAQDSTDAERKDLAAYATNFLNNASVKAAIPNIEPFY